VCTRCVRAVYETYKLSSLSLRFFLPMALPRAAERHQLVAWLSFFPHPS